MKGLWTFDEIEQVVTALVEETPGIMAYEIKKECAMGGIAERKVKMCIEYLESKGLIRRRFLDSTEFEINPDYVVPVHNGKPCNLCEEFHRATMLLC